MSERASLWHLSNYREAKLLIKDFYRNCWEQWAHKLKYKYPASEFNFNTRVSIRDVGLILDYPVKPATWVIIAL